MWEVECMNVMWVSVTACCVAQRGLRCFRASMFMGSLKKLNMGAALSYINRVSVASPIYTDVQSQNLAHWLSDMSCL